jgi:hypothetical protein
MPECRREAQDVKPSRKDLDMTGAQREFDRTLIGNSFFFF